jgi:hypothetical protein
MSHMRLYSHDLNVAKATYLGYYYVLACASLYGELSAASPALRGR